MAKHVCTTTLLRSGFTGFVAITFMLVSGCASLKKSASASHHNAQNDVAIRQAIATAWRDEHPSSGDMPDIAVTNGVVFLTGPLSDCKWRVDAVREAWQVDGVREVVDELRVPPSSDSTYAKDNTLTIKLRARLTFDPDIQSTNYSIESVGGVIYLMGLARNEDELNKVQKLAASTGATKVVNYVRIAPAATEAPKS